MVTPSNAPVVLITGALTGIGRSAALAFAKDGAKIVVSGRRDAEGEALAKELKAAGAEALFVKADVRHEAEVKHLVDATVERFGRLDIAVNNAGTEGTPGPITDQTPESFDAIFETNVLGVLLSMKHEMRAMQPQGSGSIVNVSSVAGKIGYPGIGVYVASKHAVEGLTKAAALEAAEAGIRVNAVAPGPIDTPMLNRFVISDEMKAGFIGQVPQKRFGTPEEIAQTILFVASGKANFLTGQSIAVDGGMLA